jgi:DNA invertase Pin-like site-specific DNA recombinase
MKYGYARVSPGGKSESVDAQARQLTKAGCKKVFRDVHVSGAKTDRAQLRRVIEALAACRTYRDAAVGGSIGASIRRFPAWTSAA